MTVWQGDATVFALNHSPASYYSGPVEKENRSLARQSPGPEQNKVTGIELIFVPFRPTMWPLE